MKHYLEKIYPNEKNEYCSLLKNDLENERQRFVITANPEILMMSEKDDELEKMLLDEKTSLVPDGISVVKAAKKLDIPVKERITGVEIAEYLIKELNNLGKSLYLFGATNEVIGALAKKITAEYPNIKLLGCCDGYIDDKDRIFEDIARLKPDVCLVAMGVPLQEKLIYRHLSSFDKGIFVGVGGSFDVLSGTKKRAPKFFIKCNLEWLYRIAKEPSRLKRFYNNNVKFVFKIKKEK